MDTVPTQRQEALSSDSVNKTKDDILPRKRHEELQYLDLVQEILANGEHRPDRYEYMLTNFSSCILLPRPSNRYLEFLTPVYP